MPTQIGNIKVYSSKEVARVTLYDIQTAQKLLRESKIPASKTPQGAYQITHNDLSDYLVSEQVIPKSIVDRIIDYRLEHNVKFATSTQ